MQQSLISTRRTTNLPACMPESWHQFAAPVDLRLPRQVRNSARRPVKIPYSQWARENREVTEGAHPGKWRDDYAPHTVKIMDTYCLPWVREVWLCKVEQSGGTNTLINLLLAGTDCDPGDAFILMPTEKDSNKMVGRLKNTIKASRRIKDLVSDKADETTLEKICLTNGVTWYPAHANSPASMSSRPAKYAFGDEVDKYPALAGREADPITLIKKRGRTFKGRVKRFFCSTPAGRFIYSGMLACHQVWEARVRCPHCGDLIKMDAEHLQIPEDATPENVDQLGVGYACNSCGVEWDEEDRQDAIRAGAAHWECVKGADIARPARVGFHHRAWECLDVSLAEIAAAWLLAQEDDTAAKIAWANGYEARDFERSEVSKLNIPALAARRENYGSQVPAEAGYITAGVDVQGDRLEIEVIAHGLGWQTWGLDYRQIFGDTSLPYVWQELDDYLQQTWQHSSGTELRIGCCCIDSGFRAPHVYAYTHNKRFRGIVAVKGASTANHPLVKGPNNIKHGRLRVPVASIGTDVGKELLFDHLQREQPGPGYCHFPEHYPDSYFRMLGAEEYQEKRVGGRIVGEWVKVAQRNESIDLRVYNYAALTIAAPNLEKIISDLNRIEEIEEPEKSPLAQRQHPRRGFVTGSKQWKI